MEGLNNRTLRVPVRFLVTMFSVMGIMVSLTACYKGGGSAPLPPIPPVYGLGCQNCGVLVAPVPLTTFQAQGPDGSVTLSNMQVVGQATGIQPNASGANYKWYQGPLAMQGTMTVAQAQVDYDPQTGQRASGCVVPPGVYNLQTRLVGQMDKGGVNIIIPSLITTVGAIELRIEAPSPMGLLEEGRRLWGNVYIVRVNGIPCSPHFFGKFN